MWSTEKPCRRAVDIVLSKEETAQRAEFLNSVQSPMNDTKTRYDLLIGFGFSEEQSDRIISVSIIQGDDAVIRKNKILNKMKLNAKQRKFIEDNNLLQSNVYEYEHLMTRTSMNRASLRSGTLISYVNENGNLENAFIERIQSNNLYLSSLSANERKLVIKKEEAYHPLLAHQPVIFNTKKGLPHGGIVIDVSNNEGIRIQCVNEKKDIVSMNQLGIRPRKTVDTGPLDFSSPLDEKQARKLQKDLEYLVFLYRKEGGGKAFKEANNAFVTKVQKEMRRQGVFTSLFLGQDEYLKLALYGVHPHGNRIARRYLKKTLLHGIKNLTLSPYDCCFSKTGAFFVPHRESRLEIGPDAALSILRGSDSWPINHEFRHIFLHTRKTLSLRSLYNHTLFAEGTKKLYAETKLVDPKKLEGFYDSLQDMSELYTYSFDISSLFQSFKKASGRKKDAYADNLNTHINYLLILSDNTHNFTKNMLENFDGATIDLTEGYAGKGVVRVVGADERGILISLLKEMNYVLRHHFLALEMVTNADLKLLREWSKELSEDVQNSLKPIFIFIEGKGKKPSQEEMITYYNNLVDQGENSVLDLLGEKAFEMKSNELTTRVTEYIIDVLHGIDSFSTDLYMSVSEVKNAIYPDGKRNEQKFGEKIRKMLSIVREEVFSSRI